jgi:hypothetical protein
MSPIQADAAVPNHKSPSQNLIATMARTTITSPHISSPFFGTASLGFWNHHYYKNSYP